MADLQKLETALRNADAAANDMNRSQAERDAAAADARQLAQAYRQAKRSGGFMPQLNRGIAETVGGAVDFVNPFDTPQVSQALGMGDRLTTGSARDGLARGMDAAGIRVAEGEPQNALQSLARGIGNAAGAAPIAGVATQALAAAPGLLGRVAGEGAQAMNTLRGFGTELAAGGGAQVAMDAAENAGAGALGQTAAGLLGGVAAAAAPWAATRMPMGLAMRMGGRAIRSAMLPYTEGGAQEVARRRLQDLAGGPERAAELAGQIDPGVLNLTPAQSIGDPNMLAIEQTAAAQSPQLRAQLDARFEDSVRRAQTQTPGFGGDVEQSQRFFAQRREEAKNSIDAFVQRATNGAIRPESRLTEIENSEAVMAQVRAAENAALEREGQLWAAVPRNATVQTANTRAAMQGILSDLSRFQTTDIPAVARGLLDDDGLQGTETVRDMHGLYSELRRVARSAMAGNDQNRNQRRIANTLADAILEDLGAVGPVRDEVGAAINTARAFSAELHEKFDQGTIGRLMKRTLDGDTATNPGVALDRSVGRAGNQGALAFDDILRAADTDAASDSIEDYMISRFNSAAFNAQGEFNQRGAFDFLRQNRETLRRLPYLQESLAEAARTQARAASVTSRADTVRSAMDNPARSATAAFAQANPERAVEQVFKANRPAQEAAKLAATARKDASGEAMGGLKGAFASHVINRSRVGGVPSAEKMRETLQSPSNRAALTAVFDGAEIRRMDTIASELGKLEQARRAAPDIGALSNRSPNRIIEYAARVIAARQGARAGQGTGASLQTAGFASENMRKILGELQNDKAEQMLIDAVTDPELFRVLLMDPGKIELKPEQINRLAPYFTGAAAAVMSE